MSESSTRTHWTHIDFDELSWHDNAIHGIHIISEQFDGKLMLDIDYITQWLCGTDKQVRFLIAPATLLFEDVTDLAIHVNYGDGDHRLSIRIMSIHEIRRERIQNQKICLDRPYYHWAIEINDPPGGQICFGSTGFTQTLRSQPIETEFCSLYTSARGKPLAV